MRTIVFIETNKSGSSREAIKAAERLGFFTVLFTKKQIFLEQRTDFPDVHQMVLVESIDFDSLAEKITKLQSQGKEIKAVFSFIDPFVHLAAVLTEEFCPTVVSPDPILKMEDKVLTREVIKDLPASPHYAIYTSNDSLEDFIDQQESYLPSSSNLQYQPVQKMFYWQMTKTN